MCFHKVAPGYLNSVTAIISNSGAAAVTSIIDGFAPAESLVDGKPRHRWIPLGASLTTAPFRNPFGDPPFAISQAALDAVGGKFDEQLAMCSHFELFSRLALTGLPVEISTFPVLRKSELYALRLRKLSWTQVLEEKEAAFRPFLDAVPDGSLTGLLSVRDSEPDRAPVMPEYCLAVVPERLPDIVARQADRSESAVSISTRSFKWRSVKQFSKHQGSLGWWYGYRRQEVGSETDEGFVQLANMRRIATPEGDFRMEYWTEAHRFPKQLAVSASTQHPAVALRLTNQTSKHAFLAVRRWQSSFVGNITIKGSISRGANCGDGVEFRLVVGSTVLARHKMLPTPNPVQIDVDAEAEVQVGTFVEMVVDPLGNDECDLTNGEFTLQGHPDRSVE